MEIRPAAEKDITEIVGLLKVSLGETLMPKSEAYWSWKHLQNPFGSSPVLLSVDSGAIVGVRAFMRWQWIREGRIYRAVRAVDTATHPDFQGKGIFKKLTLTLVKECEQDGDAFVFNTPNAKSKIGYLKMGWQTAGKLPVRIEIRKPLSVLKNIVRPPAFEETKIQDDELEYFLSHTDLPRLIQQTNFGGNLVTNVSAAYLRWRYKDVPVVNYLGIGAESGSELQSLIIGRTKLTRLGKEFRITDVFISNREHRKELRRKLREKMRAHDIDYLTLSGTAIPAAESFRGLLRMSLPIGPIVTVRSLHEKDLTHLQKFKTWSPSLGDLELF